MTNVEAYNILGDLWYEATSKEKEAINIAQDAVQFVDLMPKDMVTVVRCRDCKWYKVTYLACTYPNHNGWCGIDDFCSYGERKDGEG